MRANRFLRQVIAVLSRIIPALVARPDGRPVTAGLIHRLATVRLPPTYGRADPSTASRPTDMTQGAVELGKHAFKEIPSKRERALTPKIELGVCVWAFLVAVLVLWQVFQPLSQGPQHSLMIFVGISLPLIFLRYRPSKYRREEVEGRPAPEASGEKPERPDALDWVLAVLALLAGFYPLMPWEIGGGGSGYDAFLERQGVLSTADVVAGAVLLLLVLEAARRATGPVLPAVCLLFLAYSYYGGYLPVGWGIAHSGIEMEQIVNGLYNEASGFYAAPLYAAATYIVLFNIYGAVLDASGAGTFFLNLSRATFRRSPAAAGRAAVLSGFLVGTVSGSGTATTATTSLVTGRFLQRAGYPKEKAGGLLAASGIGAMLSPPTLGAAAFVIAESLGVSYVDVLVWALVPMLLYYLGIILAVEADAKTLRTEVPGGAAEVHPEKLWQGVYHLFSIVIILVFLALDYLPSDAVVYAMAAAVGFAVLVVLAQQSGTRARVRALGECVLSTATALAYGVLGALPVVAVCAAAGVITSTIAKTGLGLALSSLLDTVAHALGDDPTVVLVLTVLLCAMVTLFLGLGMPVLASFLIAWVALAPALGKVGVSRPEAAMFLFYYAVLSEVTPPTALAPLAASSLVGGSMKGTRKATWKYTLPAFLVPCAFVLTDNGASLVGQGPLVGVLWWVVAMSAFGVAALASAASGWMFGPARRPERVLCVIAALLLLYLEPWVVAAGAGFLVAAVAVHVFPRTRPAAPQVAGPEVQETSEVPEREDTSP